MNCTIPANPDISGIGVRVAIYVQNILSFLPAFYTLWNDRKVQNYELETIEAQSTTILITAFAVLISTIVQARTFVLSSFHASIVLDLSWMNNTNVFIYFLLYIHHKSYPEHGGSRIEPKWSSWVKHLREVFQLGKPTSGADIESEDQTSTYVSRRFINRLLNIYLRLRNSHPMA
jgi:hypothetical protein